MPGIVTQQTETLQLGYGNLGTGMKSKSRPESSLLQLFQAQFEQLLNHDHPLFVLASQIDWDCFDAALVDCYSPDQGRPPKQSENGKSPSKS